MSTTPCDPRLSIPERMKIAGLSVCFAGLVSFMTYTMLTTSSDPNESAWSAYLSACQKTLAAFGDGVSEGRIRTAGGILLGGLLYLIGFPLILLASLFGVFTAARGKRSRFANWVLRNASFKRASAHPETVPIRQSSECVMCCGRGWRWVCLQGGGGQVQLQCTDCHGAGRL